MTTNSDTPRTDAVRQDYGRSAGIVDVNFARTLEREIVQLKEQLETERDRNPANVCRSCGHVGDFWFDRTIIDDGLGEAMHYRCEKCGKSNDQQEWGGDKRVPNEPKC